MTVSNCPGIISYFELSTITLAKIDLVEGSTLELTDSILPLKVFVKAVDEISALKPGFKIPIKFSGIFISITIFF